jgi:hypothetical protein
MTNMIALNKIAGDMPNWRYGAVQGLGWIGIVAPLLVAKGIAEVHIASSISYDCPYRFAGNPFVDETISLAGVKVLHEQFELSRAQKCDYLATLCEECNLTKPFLRVCQENMNGNNCGKCLKCIQTILGFMAAGHNYKRFGFQIDEATIQDKVLSFMKDKNTMCHLKLWIFTSTQELLRTKKAGGMELSSFLNDFMKADLGKHEEEIDWHLFEQELKQMHGICRQ